MHIMTALSPTDLILSLQPLLVLLAVLLLDRLVVLDSLDEFGFDKTGL